MSHGYRQVDSLHKNKWHLLRPCKRCWFDTLNYELDSPLSKWKSKKVIGLMKDKLEGKIMKEFAELRAKTCSYLTDKND